MRRDARREGGRERSRGVANHLAYPTNLSHTRIDHHNAQNRNARTIAAVLDSKLDGEQRIARSLETDESATLLLKRIAHSRLGQNASAQPLGGQ